MINNIPEAINKIKEIKKEIHKVVIGQEELIDSLIIGMLCNGHILLEGVPGLAKSLTVSTFAKVLGLDFHRIQFTPDLLPSDIIGTLIFVPETSDFKVKFGPIFSNIILADEINRSPAKVQSALLEAMQEKQVSIGDNTYKLPEPFFVLATQNPIDQEGTYPLPEAQIDRFLMKVHITYPSPEEELIILERMAKPHIKINIAPKTNKEEIFQLQELINKISIDERLKKYIVNIVYSTRKPPKKLENLIQFGASPRASISLYLTAKAYALLQGRQNVIPEDIKYMAKFVLNHRIIPSYEAEVENISTFQIIELILQSVNI